jgi:Kdo2-lipid IVA lauroyltransferase/acyltransferase
MISIVHYPLYFGVRLFWSLFRLLPAKRAYPLGAAVGRVAFPWTGSRRRIAIENVLKAGIATDAAGAERIARASMGHFVGHLLESLKVSEFLTPEHVKRHVTTDFPEASRALLEKPGQPVMVITPHLGCWEVGVHLLTAFKPTMALASPMRNPLAQRFIESHLRQDVEIHSNKKGFSSSLIKRWKEGRILALAADQHAGRHGIWLDFLGRPASIHTSPARLYLATGHPMVVGAFVRTGPLRYHGVLSEPLTFALTGDRERDTVTILDTINQHFAEYIRNYPEQYLWFHRRWRQKPEVSQRRF